MSNNGLIWLELCGMRVRRCPSTLPCGSMKSQQVVVTSEVWKGTLCVWMFDKVMTWCLSTLQSLTHILPIVQSTFVIRISVHPPAHSPLASWVEVEVTKINSHHTRCAGVSAGAFDRVLGGWSAVFVKQMAGLQGFTSGLGGWYGDFFITAREPLCRRMPGGGHS